MVSTQLKRARQSPRQSIFNIIPSLALTPLQKKKLKILQEKMRKKQNDKQFF